MRRTIFSKLIKVFFVVLLIGALLSGMMLSYFLQDFVTKDKIESLESGTNDIVEMLTYYIENGASASELFYFNYFINMTSRNINSIIFIINKKGEVESLSPSYDLLIEEIKNKLLIENQKIKLPDENMYKNIIENDQILRDTRTFKGLYKDTGIQWLTYGKAYKDGKGNILGAVIISTSLPDALKFQRDVFKLFLISIIISMIISFVLIYFLSLRITLPIRAINNAVKVISNGKFDKRIEYIPDDEIGELALSFNQMSSALENLDKTRSDFMANVSHDLRTPMTSIGGFVEGILDGTIPPEKHNYYLGIVRDEVKRLNNLINNILDLAKMEAGELTLHVTVFNINEVIRRSIIKFEKMLVEKDIEVIVEFDSEETFVEADQDAIERIIINLLHNAIKFIGERKKIITISTTIIKEKVNISIVDTGEGIEEKELEFIWERFHKTDKSRNKDKVGTGLGLSIVKTLINEHGQNIKVESKKDIGTKFTFTLNYIK